MVIIRVLNGKIKPFGRRYRTWDFEKLQRTHLVEATVVLLTGIDHAVDRKILRPYFVSVYSPFLFWLPEFNDELRLMRLYLVMIFGKFKA